MFALLGTAQGKTKHPFIISLSACGGERLKLTRIEHEGARPLYVFSFASTVFWPDAALAWAVVYRKVTSIRVGDGDAVRRVVDNVQRLQLGELRYHRWDGDRYKTYSGRADE